MPANKQSCHNREQKNDREFVLGGVMQNGLTLQYASEELQNDKEVVLAAVQQDGFALKYASEQLKNYKEVLLRSLRIFLKKS